MGLAYTATNDTGEHRAGVEVSVVMPCLNEERAVGVCVAAAQQALRQARVRGEVVVADNGSTDQSAAIAASRGACVVHAPTRGYGAAYLAGLRHARGNHIVIGDADGSYDFASIGALLEPLVNGTADLVIGSRFAGHILPGAMPALHRHIGNPLLTSTLRLLFGTEVTDSQSGFRAFTGCAMRRMGLGEQGMAFASEMIIKAAWAGLRIAEVPIVYRPRIGRSKLAPLRDGWAHLSVMLRLRLSGPPGRDPAQRSLDRKHRRARRA